MKKTQSKTNSQVANHTKSSSGEGGIRTRGTVLPVRRFSKAVRRNRKGFLNSHFGQPPCHTGPATGPRRSRLVPNRCRMAVDLGTDSPRCTGDN